MSEVYVVVEGNTERTFIRDILAPYLAQNGVYLHASEIGKIKHKGGQVNIDRAKKDVTNYLKQRSDIYVSTMFDFFGIDSKWPGKNEVDKEKKRNNQLTASDKAEILEKATLDFFLREYPKLNAEKRLIPYISMHEFEALLFSNQVILSEAIGVNVSDVSKLVGKYVCPEDINEDPQKAPSKILEQLQKRYKKVNMGSDIARKIGLSTIRSQCPHFDRWISKLESLASLVI
ncbi:MAG: DUF4276 family protein [Firmicutes bacterium]|nr:DUF4276 family protein [Bacillota bacterium]